jgi:hypothetical protein
MEYRQQIYPDSGVSEMKWGVSVSLVPTG